MLRVTDPKATIVSTDFCVVPCFEFLRFGIASLCVNAVNSGIGGSMVDIIAGTCSVEVR